VLCACSALEPQPPATIDAAAGADPGHPATDAGEVFACIDGGGPSQASGSARGPQPLCSNLNAEASCLAAEASTTAERSCESDVDCVAISFAPACVDGCATRASVSKAGADAVATALESINSTSCERFDAAGCVVLPSGCPPPLPADPVCEEGQCAWLTGCALGTRRSTRLLTAASAALAAGCESDADCSVQFPSACPWSCPDAAILVATPHSAELTSLLRELQGTCEQAAAGDCPVPPCLPPQQVEPRCEAGTCVVPR
jgi:hypothetical protein